MNVTIAAIEAAYQEVTKKHSYKYKKRIADAIFWELFFEGYTNINEAAIYAYIESLNFRKQEIEINKPNAAASGIGQTGYVECYTEDGHLYICNKKDYQKDFDNHVFTVKKSILEVTGNKRKIFTLLNCGDLFADVINYDKHKDYFRNFSQNEITTALAIFIFLTRNKTL